jgi:hypothetical protein
MLVNDSNSNKAEKDAARLNMLFIVFIPVAVE